MKAFNRAARTGKLRLMLSDFEGQLFESYYLIGWVGRQLGISGASTLSASFWDGELPGAPTKRGGASLPYIRAIRGPRSTVFALALKDRPELQNRHSPGGKTCN
jgi:hypothetical protein